MDNEVLLGPEHSIPISPEIGNDKDSVRGGEVFHMMDLMRRMTTALWRDFG